MSHSRRQKSRNVEQKLKERVVLHLGLFCSHTPNFLGTEYSLKSINLQKRDVKKIDYRGKDWPVFITIKLVNGVL